MLIIMAYVKVSKIPRHLGENGNNSKSNSKTKTFKLSLTLTRKLYKVVHKTKGD